MLNEKLIPFFLSSGNSGTPNLLVFNGFVDIDSENSIEKCQTSNFTQFCIKKYLNSSRLHYSKNCFKFVQFIQLSNTLVVYIQMSFQLVKYACIFSTATLRLKSLYRNYNFVYYKRILSLLVVKTFFRNNFLFSY